MTQRKEEDRCETPGRPGASGEPGRARRTSPCRLWRRGCQSSRTPPRKRKWKPPPLPLQLGHALKYTGNAKCASTHMCAHVRTYAHAHAARTPAHAAWISPPPSPRPTVCKLRTSCVSSGAAPRLHNGSLNKRVGTFGGLTRLLRPSPSPAPQHQSPGESGKP